MVSSHGAMLDDPVQCSWIWNGVKWVPDPNAPHACPEGQECLPPTHRGVLDDTATTPCTSDAPTAPKKPGRPKK